MKENDNDAALFNLLIQQMLVHTGSVPSTMLEAGDNDPDKGDCCSTDLTGM